MNVREANDVNVVLTWAMCRATGRRPLRADRSEITDDQATVAARRLAARASATLQAGLGPDDVDLRSGDAGVAGGPGGPRGASFSNGPNPDGTWLHRQLPRRLTIFDLMEGGRPE